MRNFASTIVNFEFKKYENDMSYAKLVSVLLALDTQLDCKIFNDIFYPSFAFKIRCIWV